MNRVCIKKMMDIKQPIANQIIEMFKAAGEDYADFVVSSEFSSYIVLFIQSYMNRSSTTK